MNKKLVIGIIGIMFMVLLASNVLSITSTSTDRKHEDLVHLVRFNDAVGNDDVGTYDPGGITPLDNDLQMGVNSNFTLPPGAWYRASDEGGTNAMWFISDGDPNPIDCDIGDKGDEEQPFTWNAWIKFNSTERVATETEMIFSTFGNGATGVYYQQTGASTIQLSIEGVQVGAAFTWTTFCPVGEWCLHTITYQKDNTSIWINGTLVRTADVDFSGDRCSNSGAFAAVYSLSGMGTLGRGMAMSIDETSVYNVSLNKSQIIDYMNDGNPGGGAPAAGTSGATINISDNINPDNNTQHNTLNLPLNITVNSTSDFNATLYINGVLNQSLYDIDNGTNVLVNFSINFTASHYLNFNFSFNVTDENSSDGSLNTTIYIDNVNPTSVTNFTNNTIIMNNDLKGKFNFTDLFYLYSYNISVGDKYFDSKNQLNDTFYEYNLSLSYSNFTAGTYNLTIQYADGHTASELYNPDSWVWGNGLLNDYLKFEWEEPYNIGEVSIKRRPKDSSIFDSWSADKKAGKFSFSYSPSNKATSYVFNIEAEKGIKIVDVPNSPYKKWLIINDEHWLDFVLTNDDDYKIDIERISWNEVEVTLSNVDINLDTLYFNSIGDLNIVIENYVFHKINLTTTYENPVFETETQTITFNITKPNATYKTQGAFYYDGTQRDLTQVNESNHDLYSITFTTPEVSGETKKLLNFSFNMTLSGIDVFNNTNLLNQTVSVISINNCSNASYIKALTLVMKDEISGDNVTADLNIDLDVWIESENNYRDFSFEFRGQDHYDICIYPNETNYTTNAVLEYFDTANYTNRKYYLNNYILSNITSKVHLFLLNNSLYSDITLKVYDTATGEPIEDAYIKILRYYPEGNDTNSGGVYRLVEIERTDVIGEALAKLTLYDVFYKFIVEIDGESKLVTNVATLLTTTKILPVSLLDDALDSSERIGSVDIEVTCDDETNICRVIWSDEQNLVRTVKFEIYRLNMFGKKLLYEDTTTASSGSMVYEIVEATAGNTYKAVAHIKTNTKYSWYSNVANDIIEKKAEVFERWGGIISLFPVMLLIICVVFALMTEVGAVGVIVGSLISIIGLTFVGLLELTYPNIIILIALGGILIAKLKQ